MGWILCSITAKIKTYLSIANYNVFAMLRFFMNETNNADCAIDHFSHVSFDGISAFATCYTDYAKYYRIRRPMMSRD